MIDLAAALAGARLQRVDGPHPDLVALTFHRADLHGVLLLSTAPDAVRWGWVPERPRGAPASSFVRLLRKHAENARLVDVTLDSEGATLWFRRGDASVELRLRRHPANLLVVVDGALCGARRPTERAPWRPTSDGAEASDQPPHAPAAARSIDAFEGGADRSTTDRSPPVGGVGHRGDGRRDAEQRRAMPDTFEGMTEAGPGLVAALFGRQRETRRRGLKKAIARRQKQLRRRLVAIEGDLAGVDRVETLRQHGSLLLAHLAQLPKDATEARVTNWNTDPPSPLTIPIDPKRTPREEADALFRRARKLERGGEIALERHAETEALSSALAELGDALTVETDDEALERIEAAAAKLGVRAPGPGGRRTPRARSAHRTFEGHGGRAILVGRSAADNDTLTLRHAKPWDHWLHARGVPGSHVVVPLDRDEACPPELLADAAHLAAHFSELRGEPRAEVQHTPRRHVRKPRGAAPGAVTVQREKVLLLDLEPDRLARLLGTEER